MIRTALWLEVRTTSRSPARLAMIALFLTIGAIAIFGGLRSTENWETSIEEAQRLEDEMIAEARGHFEAARPGPPERPWVDLSEPLWQDWFAGTRIARRPAALAGIAFASAEDGARTLRVTRFADPLKPEGRRIENPELTLYGGLDLTAVIVLLLPLLVIALSLEVGAFERSTGMLPLLRLQSGHDRRWLWARAAASSGIALLASLLLVAAVGALLRPDLGELGGLALVVVLYVAFWGALNALVASHARNAAQAAIALGATWIALCVLVPAGARQASAALAADDYGFEVSVGARDLQYEIYDRGEEALLARILERHPELESAPAMELAEKPDEVSRHFYDAVQVYEMGQRAAGVVESDAEYGSMVGLAAACSPAVACASALERLAGRSSEDGGRLREVAVQAVEDRMEWILERAFSMEPLERVDYEQLVQAAPEDLGSGGQPPVREAGLLASWFLVTAGAVLILRSKRP